ncbi:seipin-like isoform X4 [Siniperca chuatsi]|uniref:seipin-like isoform X4 n=1 Tax=Siniperca chuatsi TaxID=119488 RepID=UPI001CE05D85|nr:seipin-like isoform X4 [Siniperca chuatsi]
MDQESYLHPGDDGEPSVPVGQVLLRLQDAVIMAMSRARQRVIQGFIVFSFVFLLLWISAFLYGSFYYSYIPKAAFSTPVHYYYRADCESPASFLCSYPVANISLMRNKKHVLTFGQAYRMTLQLEMPDSPVNQELGMFMVKTACFSRDGGHVASSARSARQLLSASSSRFYAPSATAFIEILSNKVQIYSSQLNIYAHFTGIRYLMFNFPILSALVGVSSNFIFLSLLFVLSYMRLLLGMEWGPEQLRADGLLSDRENNMNNNQHEDEKDAAAGTAELLGPLQTTRTNPSQEKPHLHSGDNTEVQSEINE